MCTAGVRPQRVLSRLDTSRRCTLAPGSHSQSYEGRCTSDVHALPPLGRPDTCRAHFRRWKFDVHHVTRRPRPGTRDKTGGWCTKSSSHEARTRARAHPMCTQSTSHVDQPMDGERPKGTALVRTQWASHLWRGSFPAVYMGCAPRSTWHGRRTVHNGRALLTSAPCARPSVRQVIAHPTRIPPALAHERSVSPGTRAVLFLVGPGADTTRAAIC